MNCEEYIIKRLQKLEKENEELLLDTRIDITRKLYKKIDAFKDLLSKVQLKFNDEGNYYSLEFYSYYSTLNDKGKETIRDIIDDLKTLNIDSDIVAKCEQKEKEEND